MGEIDHNIPEHFHEDTLDGGPLNGAALTADAVTMMEVFGARERLGISMRVFNSNDVQWILPNQIFGA